MRAIPLLLCCALAGCGSLQRLSELGQAPEMSPSADPTRDPKWRPMTLPMPKGQAAPNEANALWRSGSRAFFKDQRAASVGDIVTVVVSMTDSANLNNTTTLTRSSSETEGAGGLFGLTSRLGPTIPDPTKALNVTSANNNTGKAGSANTSQNTSGNSNTTLTAGGGGGGGATTPTHTTDNEEAGDADDADVDDYDSDYQVRCHC